MKRHVDDGAALRLGQRAVQLLLKGPPHAAGNVHQQQAERFLSRFHVPPINDKQCLLYEAFAAWHDASQNFIRCCAWPMG